MKRFECNAVLFDLDGVLVDSTGYVEEQWRQWARSKGLAPEPFLDVCHGRRAVETIRLAAPHLDAEAEVAALQPPAGAEQLSLSPVEGAAGLLEKLPAGTWAVATSGPRAAATQRLISAGLPVPAVLVCAEDVLCGKPSPDVYLKAAEGLGIPAAECLVIEDAPAGIAAARAAGMKVIALTTTHRVPDLPADACTASLANFQLELGGQNPEGMRRILLIVLQNCSDSP